MRRARNIYHRKDGRFEGRYVKGFDVNGKTKYGSVFARTYVECKEKLEDIKVNIVPEGGSQSDRQTLRKAVASYIELERYRLKPTTISIYKRYLDNHITPYFGNMRCAALTIEITQGFANSLLASGLSVKTVQAVFSLLRASVQSAGNPTWKVKFPKVSRYEPEFFTLEEQKCLEETAKELGDYEYMAIMLCLYAGLRIGEACGLQFEDIDFYTGVLHIRRTIQRVVNPQGTPKTKIDFLSPKSLSSERTIPLPPFLLQLLIEEKACHDSEFVISHKGKPVEPRTLQYRFKKLCTLAGVKEVNFHTTRHSFAVRALENGFDVKSLSEIMGHSNATITLERYAHATDRQKRVCMNALSAVYSQE